MKISRTNDFIIGVREAFHRIRRSKYIYIYVKVAKSRIGERSRLKAGSGRVSARNPPRS